MESGSHQEECKKGKVLLKIVRCSVCGKGAHSSASSSNHGEDICTCESSRGQSTTKSTTPNPETCVESRPCKHASKGCTELIVSTDSDHETLCGYRNTYCQNENCSKEYLVKDLMKHIQRVHGITAAEEIVFRWPLLEDNRYHAFPLYAFRTIIWEIVYFTETDVKITFIRESPVKFTPRLLAVVSIKVRDVHFADTVPVADFSEEPGELIIVPYKKIKLYRDMRLAYGCVASDRSTKVVQALRIIRNPL